MSASYQPEALSVLGDDSFEVTRGCSSLGRDLRHGLMRSRAATSHRTFGMANTFKPQTDSRGLDAGNGLAHE